MQFVSLGDILHEMSKPVSGEVKEKVLKYFAFLFRKKDFIFHANCKKCQNLLLGKKINMSAEIFTQSAKH